MSSIGGSGGASGQRERPTAGSSRRLVHSHDVVPPGEPASRSRFVTSQLPSRPRVAQSAWGWAPAAAVGPRRPTTSAISTAANAGRAPVLVTSAAPLSAPRRPLDRQLSQAPLAVDPHGRALAGHLDLWLELDELVAGVEHGVAVLVAGREAHLAVADALDLAVEPGGERRSALRGRQRPLAG